MLATLVQLHGEDKGFDFLKRLHRNINQYTKSGAAPAKAAASGETLIGITFMHDLVTFAVQGAPLKVVAPCEGTGYEVGSMSIIKGGRNPEQAKAWYDWALTPEAQAIGAEAKAFQMPSNRNAKVPPQAPRLEQTKVIDYDFAQVRLLGRAQAPAVEVGQGSQGAAEVTHGPGRAAIAWIAATAAGLVLLPWYAIEGCALERAGAAARAVQGRPWLLAAVPAALAALAARPWRMERSRAGDVF